MAGLVSAEGTQDHAEDHAASADLTSSVEPKPASVTDGASYGHVLLVLGGGKGEEPQPTSWRCLRRRLGFFSAFGQKLKGKKTQTQGF